MSGPKGDRACVLVVRDGRLLLMRRRRQGRSYDAIPGGTVEPGERFEDTAMREIREETGLEVRLSPPVLELGNQGRREVYFDAVEARGEPVLGGPEALRNSPEDFYALEWVPVDALGRRPILPEPLRRWLAERDWPGV